MKHYDLFHDKAPSVTMGEVNILPADLTVPSSGYCPLAWPASSDKASGKMFLKKMPLEQTSQRGKNYLSQLRDKQTYISHYYKTD